MKITFNRLLPFATIVAVSTLAVQWVIGQQPGTPPPAIGAQPPAAAEQDLSDFPPKKFDPRRYDAIFRKKPFEGEVIPVTETKEVEDWSKDLILRAVTRIGGKYVVHVENKSLVKDEDPEKRRKARMRIVEGSTDLPLTIQTVKPHRDPLQVEVVVVSGSGTGSKTATLKYDAAELKKAKTSPNTRKPPAGKAPTTTRRVTTTKPGTPRTARPTTTPGKRRVIMPPGLNKK